MSISVAQELRKILGKSIIQSKADWFSIIKGLSQKKLISFSEQRLISDENLRFPFSVEEAERMLIQAKQNPQLVSVLFKIKKLQEMLKGMKVTIDTWKAFGLTKEEASQLELISKNIKQRIQNLRNELQNFLKQTESVDQNFIQMLQRLTEGVFNQEVSKSAEEYQQEKYSQIQEYFDKIKVRQVIQKVKLQSKISIDAKSISTYTALNKSDFRPVQVWKIPRSFNNYKKFEQILNTFDALRQLSFSPYFQKYYGYCNTGQQSIYHYYFCQPFQGISLNNLLLKSQYHLDQQTPIFMHWCRQLFYAFNDIFHKTTYMPILPIPIDTLYVDNDGLQFKLKGVRFTRTRKQNQNRGLLQSKLLRNYGLLCLQLLGLQQSQVQQIKKLNFKMLIKALLRCQFQQIRYDSGQSTKRFSFDICKNLPLLSSQFIVDADFKNLVKNFKEIFNK